MFHAGQKVVCVDDGPHKNQRARRTGISVPLKRGKVYEIAHVTPPDPKGQLGVILVGVGGSRVFHSRLGYELGWGASRFRPVVTRKTDISVFTEILGPQREPALSSHNRESEK